MTKMKKIFSLFMCLMMLMTLLPVGAMAAGTVPEGTTLPSGIDIDYDGNQHQLFTNGIAPAGYVLSYSSDGEDYNPLYVFANNTATDVGAYTLYWEIVENESEDDTPVASGTVTSYIRPAVTAPTANTGLEYDKGNAQELVSAGTAIPAGEAEMFYSLDNSSWSTDLPTATNAGDYTVYYKAVCNGIESKVGTVAVTIAALDQTPDAVVPDGLTATYGQKLSELALGRSTAGETPGTWEWINPDDSVGEAGSVQHAVRFVPDDTNTYKVLTDKTVAVKVDPKPVTVSGTATAVDREYDGTDVVDITGTLDGVLEADKDSVSLVGKMADKNKGDDKPVTLSLAGNKAVNYVLDYSGTLIVDIAPKALDLSLKEGSETKEYDGTSTANPQFVLGGVVAGDDVELSYTNAYYSDDSGQEMKSAGSATHIQVKGISVNNSNYTVDGEDSFFGSITPKTVTNPSFVGLEQSYQYTGQAIEPQFTLEDEQGNEIDTLEYTVTYAANTDAGEATITVTDAAGGNYTVSGTTKFNINKLQPTVSEPAALSATYGQTLKDITLPGSSAEETEGTWSWVEPDASVGAVTDSTGRKFAAVFTPVDSTNYATVEMQLTVVVNKAKVTVTPTANQSKTYGEQDPVIGYTATGLVPNDVLTGELSRQSGGDVGSYPITIGTLANDNYEITLTAESFEIRPLALTAANTVITVAAPVEYDGAVHDGFVSAVLNGSTTLVEGTDFTLAGNSSSALGSHVITLTGKGNYSGSVTATWVVELPEIADDLLDGTIDKDNVLTGLTADKLDAIVNLADALESAESNTDATDAEKQQFAAVQQALDPVMEELAPVINDILSKIDKWLDDNLSKADADELGLRADYERLEAWLKGDGAAYKELIEQSFGEELEKMEYKLYTYIIIGGNGSVWLTTGNEPLSFKCNGHINLYKELRVDGLPLARDKYELVSGSTIVRLKADYLKTLDKGTHTIQFVYNDGSTGLGSFTIADRWVDVATGDDSQPVLWLSLMLMSLGGIAVCIPRLRRKEEM